MRRDEDLPPTHVPLLLGAALFLVTMAVLVVLSSGPRPGSDMARANPPSPGCPQNARCCPGERNSFGFLVGGALVLLRQRGPLGQVRTLLAVTAALLALLVFAVLLSGGATFCLATAVVVVLLYSV